MGPRLQRLFPSSSGPGLQASGSGLDGARLLALALAFALIVGRAGASVAQELELAFASPGTVVEVGRTRMVAFTVEAKLAVDTTIPARVADPRAVRIVGEACLPAGRTVGFVRVLGLAAGRTTLEVGTAAIELTVVAPRAPREDTVATPEIVGPLPGSTVSGVVAVGVEWHEEPHLPRQQCTLRVGSRETFPVEVSPLDDGPRRRARFEVDATTLEAGPVELVAASRDERGATRTSEPITVSVRPSPARGDIIAREAEEPYTGPFPDGYEKPDPAPVEGDLDASGGRFVHHYASEPPTFFPVTVDRPGRYQLVVTAAGSFAGGAFPSIGVLVDFAADPVTTGRVLSERWHRLVVGLPVTLDAGKHVIVPYFVNDFYSGVGEYGTDRNLKLDRLELIRVPDAEPAIPELQEIPDLARAASRGGGAMSGGAMRGGAMRGEALMKGRPADVYGRSPESLRVALITPRHGDLLPGDFSVEGACYREGAEVESDAPPPPRVALVLNGETIAAQRAGEPVFPVETARLRAGENTVQLVAETDGGDVSQTPVITVHWPGAAGRPEDARAYLHLTMSDTGVVALPEDLAGDFEVAIEAEGKEADGPPLAAVVLRKGAERVPLAEIVVEGGLEPRTVGTVRLAPGPKSVEVSERAVRVRAIALREVPTRVDSGPPSAIVVYPPEGHVVCGADAVVVEAFDDTALASVELVVDGRPAGFRVAIDGGPGRRLLPLIARDLAPGPHTLAVRAVDGAGRIALSSARSFVAVAGTAEPEARSLKPGARYERAVRLLDRFAFGPDEAELAAILTMGERAWLEDRLARGPDDPGDAAALGRALTELPDGDDAGSVIGRALAHALFTPNPVRARLAFFLDNHFSTWISKAGADAKWREHVTFARLGPAPFADLLLASARSPAMLVYLDQAESFGGQRNENYAREVMELHTLGVSGGYTQEDVTHLAGILTGWTAPVADDGSGAGGGPGRPFFRFDPALSENAAFRFLGVPFPPARRSERYDRALRALEMLAAHPSTARFIATKLCEHYVCVPAPDALVAEVAQTLEETGGDTRAALLAIAASEAFFASPDRLAHPLDVALRLGRTARLDDPYAAVELLSRSEALPFGRPSPDGYPEEDEPYADSSRMLRRWHHASSVRAGLASVLPEDRLDASRALDEAEGRRIVDYLAVRLTGRLLSARSEEACLEVLSVAEGDRAERIQELAAFLAMLPEAGRR